MREVMSCGILLFRAKPACAFLLLRHPDRFDLPKGHREPGESELDTALREFEEETGIAAEHIRVDPDFRYELTYRPRYKRFGGERLSKTVVIFLAWLVAGDAQVDPSEHEDFAWIRWPCSRRFREPAIAGVLDATVDHFAGDFPHDQ